MPEYMTLALPQTNCFFIKAKHGYLLVDCGRAQDKGSFLQAINKIGVSVTDISYLFLTHHHNDHCGLLDFLLKANPSLRVIMSSKCAEYLAAGIHQKHVNERYANTALDFIIGTYTRINKNWSETYKPYYYRKEDIIIEVDDDSILPKLGINGKILMTPGHTEDCISLVTGQTAFVGDAARNTLNFAGMPYYPILLYDADICRASWKKLVSEGVKKIFPAHGKPFDASQLITIGISQMESSQSKPK
ncbi:MAG: MBL fold metallo-hydrolase [Firmicutes bacterium]|nr:MBL fold metallo-hydrolase [Bacillota bacterium]